MYRRKPAQQSTLTQTMNYDGLGRLREVKYPARTETYTYDGASNPLDIAALFSISQSPLTPRPTYGIQVPEHPPVESWATVLHNQVRLYQGDRYEYDALGRLKYKQSTQHGEQWFYYDAEQRLSRVESLRDSTLLTRTVTTLRYDPLGRRIQKRVEQEERELPFDRSPWQVSRRPAQLTDFIWSGMQMVQESRRVADEREATYHTYVYEVGSYAPIARLSHQGAYRLGTDRVGSDQVGSDQAETGRTEASRVGASRVGASRVRAGQPMSQISDCAYAREVQRHPHERKAMTRTRANPNAQETGTAQQTWRYYHNDVNGAPRYITDVEGQLVWRDESGIWGNYSDQLNWAHSANADSDWHQAENLRYQGQYRDVEIGLHYNTFRYYDPALGRFTQPDPIGLAGGWNLYQYAPNPLSWVDPWGWCRSSSGNGFFFFIRRWHDKRATELFGPGKGKVFHNYRYYDKSYRDRDIEYKSDNFSKGPRTKSGLERMHTQLDKDIQLKGRGRAEPHWHFEHDPRVASEMLPLLQKMKTNGIPWTYGSTTPF